MCSDQETSEFLANLNELRKADPTNVSLARRHWDLLGAFPEGDIRHSGHVLDLFEPAAMDSKEGVVALARAFWELFESSGSPPQCSPQLRARVREILPVLTGEEFDLVRWLLSY